MTTYYKALRPDGTDFYSGTVQWAPAKTKARAGRVVKHPTAKVPTGGDFRSFLSVSTDPTRLPMSRWPMRLLEVEPVGDLLVVDYWKRGGTAFRVVAEIDPAIRFGSMGRHVMALIDRARSLTPGDDVPALTRDAARGAAWSAARGAAWSAARDAAWDAAWGAAWSAARSAVGGLMVRDLIGQHGFTQDHYDLLTGPWRKTFGPIHPDDAEMVA